MRKTLERTSSEEEEEPLDRSRVIRHETIIRNISQKKKKSPFRPSYYLQR